MAFLRRLYKVPVLSCNGDALHGGRRRRLVAFVEGVVDCVGGTGPRENVLEECSKTCSARGCSTEQLAHSRLEKSKEFYVETMLDAGCWMLTRVDACKLTMTASVTTGPTVAVEEVAHEYDVVMATLHV